MLPCYVLLDLETTGGNALHDRITEIAAVRVEGGMEVARWSTLVNPEVRIPYFIEQLTGIRNAMVAAAPTFDEVGQHLLQLLDGAVLVAHNVRFDHGFLQHEFARVDVTLRVKTLCTVRLSRLLYPQVKGHGLDAIMQRHGIATESRHRAMGDVLVMQQWLAQVTEAFGIDLLRAHAQTLLQGSAALPPQLETPITDIPESPGVYLFYGEGPIPLYVGKSVKLRSRVMSHFQAAGRESREMRIAQEIRRVEWIETAGELGALLLEARLVKQHQPIRKIVLQIMFRDKNQRSIHLPQSVHYFLVTQVLNAAEFPIDIKTSRLESDSLTILWGMEKHLCAGRLGYFTVVFRVMNGEI